MAANNSKHKLLIELQRIFLTSYRLGVIIIIMDVKKYFSTIAWRSMKKNATSNQSTVLLMSNADINLLGKRSLNI